MSRILPVTESQTSSEVSETLAEVKARLGMIPNLFGTLAHSPVALNAYLQMNELLGAGELSPRQREIVALATGQFNQCQYCLSAHAALGRGAGLSDAQITQARQGTGENPVDAAVAGFVQQLLEAHGQVADSDWQTLLESGVSASMAIEIVANVALNVLTNYVNHVAGTAIDFPVVDLESA